MSSCLPLLSRGGGRHILSCDRAQICFQRYDVQICCHGYSMHGLDNATAFLLKSHKWLHNLIWQVTEEPRSEHFFSLVQEKLKHLEVIWTRIRGPLKPFYTIHIVSWCLSAFRRLFLLVPYDALMYEFQLHKFQSVTYLATKCADVINSGRHKNADVSKLRSLIWPELPSLSLLFTLAEMDFRFLSNFDQTGIHFSIKRNSVLVLNLSEKDNSNPNKYKCIFLWLISISMFMKLYCIWFEIHK